MKWNNIKLGKRPSIKFGTVITILTIASSIDIRGIRKGILNIDELNEFSSIKSGVKDCKVNYSLLEKISEFILIQKSQMNICCGSILQIQ